MQTRPTSLEAFASVKPDIKIVREFVYEKIARAGERGMTCDELEQATGMAHQTASARIYDLHKAGRIIEKDGANGKRPTRSGRAAIVWVAPSQGKLPFNFQ